MSKKVYNKVLFVVTEKHMLTNMKPMLYEIQKYPAAIHLYVSSFSLIPFINRLKEGKRYLRSLKKDFKEKVPSEFCVDTLIIYSNAEGFWISNKQYWIPLLTGCKEVFLQHGIMPMSVGYSCIRELTNFFSSLLVGYNLVGKGFGGINADYIIVYGNAYKKYLVNKKGWKDNQVLVSGYLFKSCPESLSYDKAVIPNSCLLLLQDLSVSYMSEQKFISYCHKIVKDLSLKYETIIVRKHPKMSVKFENIFSNIKNVCISHSSLETDILSVGHVYSFFSTALIDAYLFHRKVVAIKLPEISINVYVSFNRVVCICDLKKYLLTQIDTDEKASINSLYFDVTLSVNDILENLLCK